MLQNAAVPTDQQKEENGNVAMHYGVAMLTAQTLEQAIAVLSMTLRLGTVRNYDDPSRTQAAAERLLEDFWEAVQTQSVGTQLSFLESRIPDDLFTDIAAWIKRRNEIAHRFLVRRYIAVGSQAHTFEPGTLDELRAFVELCSPLQDRVFKEASSQVVRADLPEPVRAIGRRFLDTIMLRDKWPE